MQPNTSPAAHFPRFPWAAFHSCLYPAYYTTFPFCMFYMFYTAEIGYWQGEGLTTEDGGQRMGDGGRTTKDRGLRCDQRALPFPCIPCISWFNSLRPLRSLRLQSRCPILKILLIQCKPSTRSTRPSSLSSIPSSSFGIVSTGLFAATILNHTLLLQSCNSSLNGPSAFAQDGNQSSYINPRIVSYCLFYCAIYSAIYSAIYRLMLLAQKGQTLPYMFYCICLPHIIFHRSNSTPL